MIQCTATTPEVDRHLFRLWETRDGLLKTRKQQKLNRKLRFRTEVITEARECAIHLAQQNSIQFCGSLKGTLGTTETWTILRCLIEPDSAKLITNRTLQEIAYTSPSNDQDLLKALRSRCCKRDDPIPPCPMKYSGGPNPELEVPITMVEVYAAAYVSQRNTAPGADKITNAMIRNLSPAHIQDLAVYLK